MLKLLLAIIVLSTPAFALANEIPQMSSACENPAALADDGLALIKSFRHQGVRPHMMVEASQGPVWHRTQDIVSQSFGFPKQDLLIHSVSELRFLPYTLSHRKILLIVQRDRELTEARALKVLQVAKMKNIVISVLWIGPGESPILSALSAKTSGTYLSTAEIVKKTCFNLVLSQASSTNSRGSSSLMVLKF
ncbi:hypothetical protein [Pseudobacteriovorax antillogorgiicola]|uniref:Uncharacterized protein n=1 Tax=Pseudobacteriovorax antillogorgiicola TaxID=1513793 RepID=A0A1Y6CIF7_9BACT|nr:hypothetical protein [Pseudobacteriovorax antillogorgiicola]TCS48698.1 hypothetical protein EDD56_117120 [Pseudobacteriovorax antillogorgiicola]SMF54741.1 hypothetical protein SAMN06296036_11739 [Pseudobacteriovorax antillogorgiicola]